MSKSLAASKKVMKNYLSELMTEEPIEPEKEIIQPEKTTPDVIENERLEALLHNVTVDIEVAPEELITQKSIVESDNVDTELLEQQEEITLTTQKSSGDDFIVKTPKSYREGNFQALFFNVAGLTLAVPLIELGGIHKVDKTTSLMGKPDWFKGVMLYRDEKINVVDTALWVMPEKCDETLKNSLNYQYIIMLSNSRWGLMAENLVDTVVLNQEEVKWLDSSNKRPWLAGLVKDKMCALLDVDSLIELLNEGSGINQLD